MTRLEKLKNAKSKSDLATLLGFKLKNLTYIVYKIPEENKYQKFTVPKKGGGNRILFAPNDKLKLLQRRLADLLLDCDHEITQKSGDTEKANLAVAHGFRKGLSILTNADQHVRKKYVLNVDLEDFFFSFNFGRVRGFFLKDKNFKLAPEVATVIAQIACYENMLPQGSPCSPVISNLISRYLDIKLLHFAKVNGCTYTRYADDITFSTNKSKMPRTVAKNRTFFISHKWKISSNFKKIVEDSGFKINDKKTRVQHRTTRQDVTGLTVNKLVNVKKDYYRNLRAMCNSMFQNGRFYLPVSHKKSSMSGEYEGNYIENLDVLEGRLEFVYRVKKHRNKYAKKGYRQYSQHIHNISKRKNDNHQNQLKHHRANSYSDENHFKSFDGIKNLYARFLYFKNLYRAEKPLVVCEGKTDYVYLECAFNQLKQDFKGLFTQDEDVSIRSFRFFKMSKKNAELLFFNGGTSVLEDFLDNYKYNLKFFKSEGGYNPVIIILDNDKAGKGLLKKYKAQYNQGDFYCKLFFNVYALFIPSSEEDGNETVIENLFDKDILETKLAGKMLCLQNKLKSTETHYSKHAFAEEVIKKKQKTINFDRFRPIFESIEAIMRSHK